jgi:hypothetical protein
MKHHQKLAYGIDRLAFWIVVVNLVLASFLLISFTDLLTQLLMEDALVETAGAAFLLLTAIVLLAASFHLFRRKSSLKGIARWRFIAVLGAGILFLVAFGEEISWGQRIFQFETPEFVEELNRQNEINLHNLDTRMFNNAVETLVLLIILISTVWIHRQKDRLFGFVIPSYWLILSLQMIAAYVTYNYVKTQDYTIYLVLLYFVIVHYRARNWHKLGYVVVAIITITSVGMLNAYFRDLHSRNGLREFRECLFSFIFFIYSLSIYLQCKYEDFRMSP